MKLTYLLGVLLFICSCNDHNNTDKQIKLGTTTAYFAYESNRGMIRVNANKPWKAESENKWIHIITDKGLASKALHYEIDGNLEEKERQGKITITSNGKSLTYTIRQKAKPIGVNLKYRIPIIFHVLYEDGNDEIQNPPYKYILDALNTANNLMQHAGKNDPNDPNDPESSDLGVQFEMAIKDPHGNILKEPGVERIKWHERFVDAVKFIKSEDPKQLALLWDPNHYVNIFLSNHRIEGLLGIATFPVLPKKYAFKHISVVQDIYYVPGEKVKDMRCVCINSSYLKSKNPLLNTGATIAHELGHYFGLRHAFSEAEDKLISCQDTDGCIDTPSYDKTEYDKYKSYLRERFAKDATFKRNFNEETLYERHSCDGKKFISRNIMDYDYCKKNLFTEEQRKIVRTVLENALFIPGPKHIDSEMTTRAILQHYNKNVKIPHEISNCPEIDLIEGIN